MNDVLHTLDTLGWEADKKIHALNFGGCGVFASLVARKLEEQGIPVGIVCGSYRHDGERADVDKARSNVENKWDAEDWNANGVYFGHVGVEFELNGKLYHYDSDGVKPAGKYIDGLRIAKGRLTVEEMELLASEGLNWNPVFPRNQIPKLRDMVEKAFEH